jgi:hemerythrin
MKLGKGNAVLGKIISGLIDYTVSHFRTEEKYFDRYGYPETDRHKKEHSDFVDKVSEFKNGFDQGKLSVSVEVMRFLSQWLQNHIKGTDKKYGPFLNEKGLK